MSLSEAVRAYWEAEPCGSGHPITGDAEPHSPEWFARIEAHRYRVEPFIHAVAEFPRWRGKRLLEVGVGAGTDHLQFARAGARCHGVDLTDAAIETTRRHLAVHGLSSDLRRVSAESLPFPDGAFDVVYSWGVIHHAERPEAIVAEIHRVLAPGGVFIGMLYGRRSLVALRLWLKHALLRGRPWQRWRQVVAEHMESPGTRSYTLAELRRMFGDFARVELRPIVTSYDLERCPAWLGRLLPLDWGWFVAIEASR